MREIVTPLRQLGLEIGKRGVERLAKGEDIAAPLHDDANLERRLPLRADEKRRRILIAVRDFGHVAEPEGLSAGEDRRFRHRLGALLRAGHSHRQPLRVGLEFARGAKRVLLARSNRTGTATGTPSVASLAWLNSTKMRSAWSP